MNASVFVRALDHRAPPIAERIHAVQMAAYSAEAKLIGAVNFAPLARTVAQVRSSAEQFFGAFANGELIGIAGVEHAGQAGVCISSLVVVPEWHRRGVGRTLLRHLLDLYSVHELQVQTAARNLPALAFYRQAGFVEVRRLFVGAQPLELVMLLRPPPKPHNVA